VLNHEDDASLCTATHYNTLQHTATYCHTLQYIAALMARGSVGALPPRARSFSAEEPYN